MVHEELRITVPSLFRCPISMDVMKSPVSLCTGVTYDRASIQRWLESGHETCPATNLPLPSKDFIPNLTLHRLINRWIQQSSSPSTAASISRAGIRTLIENIARDDSGKGHRGALEKVAEYASFCEENRRFLAESDGFVEVVADLLRRGGSEIEVLELAVRILNSIVAETGVKERLSRRFLGGDVRDNWFSSFQTIFQRGSLTAKTEATRFLESIAIDNKTKRSIAENQTLLSELLRLLAAETDEALLDAVLSCLIISTATRSIMTQLVQLGLVPILSSMISESSCAVPTAVEKALRLTRMVTATAEGRQAMSEEANRGVAPAVTERLMKLSKAARGDAVAVLWSMCCICKDGRATETVARSNGVTKVLLVMQSLSQGEESVKRMCVELVKALRAVCKVKEVGGSSELGWYETRTTHIRPC